MQIFTGTGTVENPQANIIAAQVSDWTQEEDNDDFSPDPDPEFLLVEIFGY